MTTVLLILAAVLVAAGLAGMLGKLATGDGFAALWWFGGGMRWAVDVLGWLLAAVVRVNRE